MKPYASYMFRDKDPIIDRIRTLISDAKISHAYIELHSGVTARTLYAWFHGETKRPQHATVAAVVAVLGYHVALVKSGDTRNVVPIHRKVKT